MWSCEEERVVKKVGVVAGVVWEVVTRLLAVTGKESAEMVIIVTVVRVLSFVIRVKFVRAVAEVRVVTKVGPVRAVGLRGGEVVRTRVVMIEQPQAATANVPTSQCILLESTQQEGFRHDRTPMVGLSALGSCHDITLILGPPVSCHDITLTLGLPL